MTKLRLGPVVTEKPVKVTIELSAEINQDLKAYAELMKNESGQSVDNPTTLMAPMLKQFMATDRAFRKLRRQLSHDTTG